MNDLISREAAIKMILEGGCTAAALGRVVALPTIDAEPVQRGVWEWYENWWHGECDEYGWRCSVCGVSLADTIEEAIGERPDLDDPDKVPTMKRCPNCEARMNVGEQVNADPRGKGWGY